MQSPAEPKPSLWTLLKEDFKAHDSDWTRPGFQAIAVYRLGVWRMKIAPRPLRVPFSFAYRAMFVAVRNFYGIELPFTAQIGRRVVFEHQHGIVVHGNTVIGDDCIVRHGVTFGIRRMESLHEAPVLGRGVNVGAGAKIIGAISVGDGAAIGANAVVLHDVPAGALVIGAPAKVVERKGASSGASQPQPPASTSDSQAEPPASTSRRNGSSNGNGRKLR